MQTEPLVANVPYMLSHGNHERDWPDSGGKLAGDDSGGECGVATERRYLMPAEEQDAPWYGPAAAALGNVLGMIMHVGQYTSKPFDVSR